MPLENNLKAAFVSAMSKAACTVNIVTTAGPAGRSGATVSAMSSVSADGASPTLLVCMNQNSVTAQAIRENGTFCVNILKDDQSAISDRFAGRMAGTGDEKFSPTDWEMGVTGAPRLRGGLISFECRLANEQQISTHHIFIGEVIAISDEGDGMPLIYSGRAYGRPARIEPEPLAVSA